MNIKELLIEALPIIKNFAPSIGAAIGGPVGLTAGTALHILANTFESTPSNPLQLVEKIVKDPDSQKKLEKVEQEHGEWLSSLMDSVDTLSKAEFNIKLEWKQDIK